MRDQPLAVLDSTENGGHRLALLRNRSDDVVLLTNGAPSDIHGADVRPVQRLEMVGGELDAVVFGDGSRLSRSGILVPAPLRQRSGLAAQLGVDVADATPVTIDSLATDVRGATNVAGVFAAGDVSAAMPQVAAAIAAGSMAAAAVVQSFVFGV